MQTLETLKFQNILTKNMPIDKSNDNNSRIVKGSLYSQTKPTPIKNPKLVCYSAQNSHEFLRPILGN